jgi:hypothetical protein
MGVAKTVGVDLGESEGEIDANIKACRVFDGNRTKKQMDAPVRGGGKGKRE